MPNAILEPGQIDVLIIGGGVQGLWLLNDLHQARYSALLLERQALGGEQTCHSHLYIHKGHLYRHKNLAERLRGVEKVWEGWIDKHAPERGCGPSLFGFQNPGDADKREALWKELQLAYKLVSPPSLLSGTCIKRFFESPEICLSGESLIKTLCREKAPFLSLIQNVEQVSINSEEIDADSHTVKEVHVTMPQGMRLIFRPKALVLAAGKGNQALLELTAGGQRSLVGQVRDAQQIRKAHMLIVKGKKGALQPLTGVFPDLRGLFMVAREFEDEVVWLVSDDRSPPIQFTESWMEFDARWWLRQVLMALQRLAPTYFKEKKSLQRLKWGVYEAPKAEGKTGGRIPHEERIEKFGFKNLWAVWPTKLTLAPKVSSAITDEVRQFIGPPKEWTLPQAWNDYRCEVRIAPERWRKTPLMSWKEFCRCFDLDYLQ